MIEREIKVTQGHVGFLSVLALIFITLKLIGIIKWSWWWVLAPLWIPMAIVICLIGICLIVWVFTDRKR